jgi:hypothetical protein
MFRPRDEKKQEAPSFDWVLWFKWILVSTLGWLTGFAFPDLLAAAIGVAMGILQWLVLRSLFQRAGWWVLASGAGWAVGFVAITYLLPEEIAVLQGIILGASIGVAQWIVLRQWVPRAYWWMPMSALGWAVGPILGALLVGGVVGAATGFTLELLVRHPYPETFKGMIPQPENGAEGGDRG